MLPRTVSRIGLVMVAVLALVAMALVPAAPVQAAAVDIGFDVRFTGVIQTVGSETEDWVIGGQTVATDEDTTMIEVVEPEVGLWADVAAKKLEDGSLLAAQITVRKEQARLQGVVESMPAEGAAGEWVISGVTVNTTEDTKLNERAGEIAVGNWVEAVMTEDQGVLTAHHIYGVGEQDAVIVNGEIQEIGADYWVLSSIKVMFNEETLISGEPVVGLIGRAAAEQQEDDSLLARALRVAWLERNGEKPVTEFTGTVTKMDVARVQKTITVETDDDPAMEYVVRLLPNTSVHQEKGLLTVGATVHVEGLLLPANMGDLSENVIATEVTVLESPEEGGEFVLFRGAIESLPAEGVKGEWMVGDQKVVVDDNTQLFGRSPEVGFYAVGGGVKRADGSILAGRVTVMGARQP